MYLSYEEVITAINPINSEQLYALAYRTVTQKHPRAKGIVLIPISTSITESENGSKVHKYTYKVELSE